MYLLTRKQSLECLAGEKNATAVPTPSVFIHHGGTLGSDRNAARWLPKGAEVGTRQDGATHGRRASRPSLPGSKHLPDGSSKKPSATTLRMMSWPNRWHMASNGCGSGFLALAPAAYRLCAR